MFRHIIIVDVLQQPFVLALGLYLLLGVSRHWWSLDHLKKGDDVARWETRAARGDAVAVAAAVAVPLLGLVLATTTISARRRRETSTHGERILTAT